MQFLLLFGVVEHWVSRVVVLQVGKSCWGRLGDSVGYVAEAGVGADVGCGVNDNIPIIAIFVNTFFLFV